MAKLLQAPISYQGSKRNELDKIDEFKPKQFNKFIDIFGGGGSVGLYFLQKYPELKEIVYNDISKIMVQLFNVLKNLDKTNDLLKDLDERDYNDKQFFKINKNFKHQSSSINDYLFLQRMAFRGIVGNGSINKHKNKDTGELEISLRKNYYDFYKYPPVLSNDKFKIYNLDCIELIDKYKDDDMAFIYLDPPYISCDNRSYCKYDLNDVMKLFDIIKDKSYKCKIMIHIELIGYTYDHLKNHMKNYYIKNYNLRSVKNYPKYIMIATNY